MICDWCGAWMRLHATFWHGFWRCNMGVYVCLGRSCGHEIERPLSPELALPAPGVPHSLTPPEYAPGPASDARGVQHEPAEPRD